MKNIIDYNLILIISIICLTTFIYCDRGLGKCKSINIKTVQNFKPNQYLGKWYEQHRDKKMTFQKGDCVVAEYKLIDDGSKSGKLTISVTNSELELNESQEKFQYLETEEEKYKNKNKRRSVIGRGFGKYPTDPALLISFAPEFLDYFDFIKGPYWILDTDYDNYAFVYSCKEIFGLYHTEFFWILTREKNPSQKIVNSYINKIVTEYGYSEDNFRRRTIQGNEVCFDYK